MPGTQIPGILLTEVKIYETHSAEPLQRGTLIQPKCSAHEAHQHGAARFPGRLPPVIPAPTAWGECFDTNTGRWYEAEPPAWWYALINTIKPAGL